jgi:hypothetical protein
MRYVSEKKYAHMILRGNVRGRDNSKVSKHRLQGITKMCHKETE